MHINSLETYSQEKGNLETRKAAVLGAFISIGRPATDREIMAHLEMSDPNSVRPRITELCNDGVITEQGKAICHFSGRKVRVCGVTSNDSP
jgi:hypothetical protein